MKRCFVVVTLLLLAFQYAMAGQSNNSNFISGSLVLPNASFQVFANSYASYPNPVNFTDVEIQNLIAVEVDHTTGLYIPNNLDYTVQLEVTGLEADLVTTQVHYLDLVVQYSKDRLIPYQDKSVYELSDYVKLTVRIISIADNSNGNVITDPEDIFVVRGEVNIKRYYNFAYASAPTGVLVTPKYEGGNLYEYNISWTPMVGAEEYELEWTWVDDFTASYNSYSTSGKRYNFKTSTSRLLLTENSFNISNLFDHGVVVFRIRGVGRNPANWDKRLYGSWTVTNESGLISSLGGSALINVDNHKATMNWSYQSHVGDDGIKQEFCGYFDGQGLTRQMVRKNYEENEVVVSETYYDYQGREAVNALPSPTASRNKALQYYQGFNLNSSLAPYSRVDFDLDASQGACDVNTGPFHQSSGAGNYYSSSNAYSPSWDYFNAHIADAAGYPFQRIEYTPDNSGRVRRKTNVGPEFQLGSGHEVKIYYGKPSQFELDRVFGSEAGYSRYYKKVFKVDADGQGSIIIKDMNERVIMTASVGAHPDNAEEMTSSSQALIPVTIDLLEKEADGHSEINRQLSEDGASVYNSTFLVTEQGTYDFEYEVTAPAYTDGCLNPVICFDCTYDLLIRITDDCGNVQAERTEYVGSGSLNTTCENPLWSYSSTADPISLSLGVGNYNIYKELKVHVADMDYYLSVLMDSTKSCFKTEAMFIAEELALVDASGCEVTCEECVEGLGTRDAFVLRGLGTEEEWEVAYQNCIEPCQGESKCKTFYRLMLTDMSPGGQYAEWFDSTTGRMNTAQYPLSIFNPNNYLTQISGYQAYWRFPNHADYGFGYYNEDGTRVKILVTDFLDGQTFPEVINFFIDSDGKKYAYPEDLANEADFILFWKNSWAKSLVQYHPEYCYFEWCDGNDALTLNNQSSEEFDELIATTTTKSNAVNGGVYSDPTSSSNMILILNQDPYFATGGRGAAQKTAMQSLLQTADFTGTGYSIFELAGVLAKCPGTFTTSGIPDLGCTDFGVSSDPNVLNAEWVAFRNLYLAEKQKLQDAEAHRYVKDNCTKRGINGCIGTEEFNPLVYGITVWDTYQNNDDMACGYTHAGLYESHVKRYITARDLSTTTKGESEYNHFYMTGKCPEATYLEGFMNGVIGEANLFNTFSLKNKIYFNEALYEKVNAPNGGIVTTYTEWTYVPTVNAQNLVIQFEDQTIPDFSTCDINLNLPVSYQWSDVKQVLNFGSDPLSSSSSAFVFDVMLDHDQDPLTPDITVQGSGSSCFAVGLCQFETHCEPSAFASDLLELMNVLLTSSNQDLLSTTDIDLESPDYNPYLTNNIKTYMSPITNMYRWRYDNSTNKFWLHSANGSTTNKVYIEFQAFDPSSFGFGNLQDIEYFASIQPDPQTANGFFILAYYDHDSNPSTPAKPVTIKGILDFTVSTFDGIWVNGTCGPQTPKMCQTTEHRTAEDLGPFLDELINNPPAPSTNLNGFSQWTSLLQYQLGLGDYKIGRSGIEYDNITYEITSDEFIPGAESTICKLRLYRYDPYFNDRYDFADIIALREIEVDRNLLIDGKAYHFTILAEYSNGVTERIAGYTSCLPVKDCACKGGASSEGDGGPAGTPPEQCQGVYKVYKEVVERFNANYFGNNGLGTTLTVVDLASFNCLCGRGYIEYLENYDPGSGPVKTLEQFCTDEECELTYQDYVSGVNAYNDAHPNSQVPVEMINGEACECYGEYLKYLQSFVDQGTPPLPFTNWQASGYCIDENDCEAMQERYREEIMRFNGSIYLNPDGYQMTPETITAADCGCLRAYIDYLMNVDLNPGDPAPMSFSDFNAAGFCSSGSSMMSSSSMMLMSSPTNTTLSATQTVDGSQGLGGKKATGKGGGGKQTDTTLMQMSAEGSVIVEQSELYEPTYFSGSTCNSVGIVIREIPYNSKCEEHLMDIAEVTGRMRYQEYLKKFLAEHSEAYKQHCLTQAQETFELDYDDRTYHYTLYYHDQAGNLVKTVPPGGVKVVTDPGDLTQIIVDRATRSRRFFTEHVLASTYEYNSLEQMTKESIPDHDLMNRWYIANSSATGQLPANFIASASWSPDPSRMIVAGTISGQGYIFQSDNTGVSWSRVGNIQANTLKAVQMATASVGYAVGEEGMLYKTTDAGQSWLMMFGAVGIASDINALYFKDASNGVVVGENGQVWITSNGGQNWTASSTVISGSVTAITGLSTTDMLITVNQSGTGMLYRSTNFGTTWSPVNSYRADDLADVHMLSSSEGFAGGRNGIILHTTNGGTTWQLVANNLSKDIRRIYFKDNLKGFVILEDKNTGGNLFHSEDGGISWKQVSTIGEYRDFSFYTAAKGYAVGNNGSAGILSLLDADDGSVAKLANLNVGSVELYSVHFNTVDEGIVAGDNGAVYSTTNATSPFLTWTQLSLGAHASENIRDVYFNTTTLGALVTENGLLLTYNSGSVTNHTTGSENFVNLKEGYGTLYALDNKTYGKVKTSTASSLTSFSTLHTYNSSTNPLTMPLAAGSPVGASSVFVVGKGGMVLENTNLQHTNVRAAELNSVSAVSGGSEAIAVGQDGGIWFSTTSGSSWYQLTIESSSELNAVSLASASTALIGGEDGLLHRYSSGTLTSLNSGTTQDILDVSHLNTSQAVFVANGGVLRKTGDGGSTWQSAGISNLASIAGLQAVYYLSGSEIIAAGGFGYVWKSDASILSRVEDVRLPQINSLQFTSNGKGVLTTDLGGLFLTSNYGKSWYMKDAFIGQDLPSAWRLDDMTLLVSDDQGEIHRSADGGNIFSIVHAGVQQINGIAFEWNKLNGAAVGNSGTLLFTIDGGLSWSAGTPNTGVTDNLNAVDMINDRVFAGGDNGAVLTSSDAGVNWTVQSSGTSNHIKDIFFHDYYTGYIVGDGGELRKSIDGGLVWTTKPNDLAGGSSTSDLSTITFATRFKGFLAGDNYSRRVTDEADLYSGFFYYDEIGSIIATENTKQFNATPRTYSYTFYDGQDRLSENGVVETTSEIRDLAQSGKISESDFISWVQAGSRKEVYRKFYDYVISNTGGPLTIAGFSQANLENAVASLTYQQTYNSDALQYDNAIHYSYDVTGKMVTELQDIPALNVVDNQYFRIDYKYKTITMVVTDVIYQEGKLDEFRQRFVYDKNTNLKQVYSSRDGVIWDKDLTNYYTRHGGKGRMELGDLKVQGIDYAFSLSGLIKGVNSVSLNSSDDIGLDSKLSSVNSFFNRDAFGYVINYYQGDYNSVSGFSPGPNHFRPATGVSDLQTNSLDFYNGNISNYMVGVMNPNTAVSMVQGRAFRYDQGERMTKSYVFENFDFVNNAFQYTTGGVPSAYREQLSYDDMGNILTLFRNGSASNLPMDDLTYRYDYYNNTPSNGLRSNRLYHVDDAVSSTYTDDIDDQGSFTPASSSVNVNAVNNYAFDEIGNMVRNDAEEIEEILWTASGKVKEIIMISSSTKPDIEFLYNAHNQKICKIIKPKPLSSTTQFEIWSVMGNDGQEIATYKKSYDLQTGDLLFYMNERIVSGGEERVVTITTKEALYVAQPMTNPNPDLHVRILGEKRFEGKDHLENVLVVFNDKKIPVDDNADGFVDYFETDVIGAQLYYSFGGLMPERTFAAQSCSTQWVPLSLQPYLEDFSTGAVWPAFAAAVTTPDAPFSRMIVDVYGPNSGTQEMVPCTPSASNQLDLVLEFGMSPMINIQLFDPNGMVPITPIQVVGGVPGQIIPITMFFTGPVSGQVVINIIDPGPAATPATFYVHDAIITSTQTVLASYCWDDEYRYGFNGMERVDDFQGNGNAYFSDHRMYDPRLGRWFSLDPMRQYLVSNSPYAHAFNNPVVFKDKNGDIGIFGAILSAALEVGMQVASNYVSGKPLTDIDWWDVGVAAASGALGIPPALNKLAKYGPKALKYGKAAFNQLDNVAQSFVDVKYNRETGWSRKVYSAKDGLTNAAIGYASSKVLGGVTKKLSSKANGNVRAQELITSNAKKAVESAKESLARTQKKKSSKGKEATVQRKKDNSARAQQHLLESRTAEAGRKAIATAAGPGTDFARGVTEKVGQDAATGSPSGSSGTPSSTMSTNAPEPPATTQSSGYLYTPQKLGNTGYYYLDRDNTQVYNVNDGSVYNVVNGKCVFDRKAHIDVSKQRFIKKP